jgi:hypothetical protein
MELGNANWYCKCMVLMWVCCLGVVIVMREGGWMWYEPALVVVWSRGGGVH